MHSVPDHKGGKGNEEDDRSIIRGCTFQSEVPEPAEGIPVCLTRTGRHTKRNLLLKKRVIYFTGTNLYFNLIYILISCSYKAFIYIGFS